MSKVHRPRRYNVNLTEVMVTYSEVYKQFLVKFYSLPKLAGGAELGYCSDKIAVVPSALAAGISSSTFGFREFRESFNNNSPTMKTTWKDIQPVPTSQEFLDIVLSRTQRRLPTQIRAGFQISRIRSTKQNFFQKYQ